MSANIDYSTGKAGFISYMQPAWWDGSGERVSTKILTVEDALKEGGLDFEVIKAPNIHRIPEGDKVREIISKSSFFTYRNDTLQVLGDKLGSHYTVFQNREVLDFVSDMMATGEVSIETAGSIDKGRRVFVCLKLKNPLSIGDKDVVVQYFLIANGHDGSLAITALPTNVRVVCQNTLGAALGGAKPYHKFRHTANASQRLQESLKVLGLIEKDSLKNEAAYNAMKHADLTKKEFFDYIGNVFFTPKEIGELQKGNKDAISTRKDNIISSVLDFSDNGIGQKEALDGGNMNMWWAYNAITGALTGKKYKSTDDRTNSLLFGDSAEKIQLAGELASKPHLIKPLNMQESNMILN